MNKEYINRNDLISYLEECIIHNPRIDYILKNMIRIVNERPAADVVEVKRGEWIKKSTYVYQCSLCDGVAFLDFKGEPCKYCPSCGAKMDLKEEVKQ